MVEAEDDGEAPRKGTLKYFMQHLHDPIVPGAPISVLQYCFIRVAEKQRHKIKDSYFDRDQRFFSECCGPQGEHAHNFRPPSFDMVKKILGTRDAKECERHVCACDKHVFKTAMPREYERYKNDKCPKCGVTRFTEVSRSLSAVQAAWMRTMLFHC